MLDLPPTAPPPPAPIPAVAVVARIDPLAPPDGNGAFLAAGSRGGLRLYRLPGFPGVWLLEPPDLEVQARAMNHIAHVLERRGGDAGPIPGQNTVDAWFAALGQDPWRLRIGHDFGLAEVGGFVCRAEAEGVTLNPAEAAVRDALRDLGPLADPGCAGDSTRPAGVLVVLSPPSPARSPRHLAPAEYRAVLRHELSHAEFALNPAYRAYCLAFWDGLPDPTRAVLTRRLARWHYDAGDPVRLANELQAYLWEVELGAFLDVHLRRAGTSLAALRGAFLAGVEGRADGAGRLFRDPVLRTPLARGPAWTETGTLAKRSEEQTP